MIKLARDIPGIASKPCELDRNTWLLNCRSGTVNLRRGELRPHNPSDLITQLAPVEFKNGATCPQWERFVHQITNGDTSLSTYLQRLVGILLTGDVSEQAMYILYGRGANGKSTFVDTILALLGDYACLAPPGLLSTRRHDEHPTEIADLQGRRLVVAQENSRGARLRVELVKRMTGDQTLKARRMRQDYFEFAQTHKIILATNNRPRVDETSEAIWRRIRLIPFEFAIPVRERDLRLLDKLKSELPGILNWSIRGCLAWQAEGMPNVPSIRAATHEYREREDLVAAFLHERCLCSPASRVSRTVLYNAYKTWASVNGDGPPLSRNELYDALRNREDLQEADWKEEGKSVRGFKGVRLGLTSG